ncbi:hypothetical protein GOB93_01240 [Acetobacter musti]|uniref:Transposase n=1 Tax=Acetobacter musti TaxID=864732 RepID=A0ABX0JHL3_9PROT|nr:hypothetical protein [Acetobacter musti]NHN83266.1 hypothetical protein [Acetobacter musti]
MSDSQWERIRDSLPWPRFRIAQGLHRTRLVCCFDVTGEDGIFLLSCFIVFSVQGKRRMRESDTAGHFLHRPAERRRGLSLRDCSVTTGWNNKQKFLGAAFFQKGGVF